MSFLILQHLLISLSTEIARLLVSVTVETIDIFVKILACKYVIEAEAEDDMNAMANYKIPYVLICCASVLGIITCLWYKMRSVMILNKHVLSLAEAQEGMRGDESRQKVEKIEWEIQQGSRNMVIGVTPGMRHTNALRSRNVQEGATI